MGDEIKSLDSRKVTLDPHNCEVIKDESRDASPSRKSDVSPVAISLADINLPTPRTSGAPSIAEEKSESSDYSGRKSNPEGENAFAKLESPAKTQGSSMTSENPEEHMKETSADKHEVRPATVACRGKKDGTKKPLFQNIFGLFKSSKPVKSEKAPLLDADCSSSTSEEELEGKQARKHSPDRPMLYTDVTGQVGGFLPGPLSAENDDFEENITEMTSVSLGTERCLPPSNPGSTVVSPEGSSGDASSLEREFEELPSPSECDEHGPKRTKIQNESSNNEDEAKVDLTIRTLKN